MGLELLKYQIWGKMIGFIGGCSSKWKHEHEIKQFDFREAMECTYSLRTVTFGLPRAFKLHFMIDSNCTCIIEVTLYGEMIYIFIANICTG